MKTKTPLHRPALDPATVTARTGTGYPTEEMRKVVAGRAKHPLGDALGRPTFLPTPLLPLKLRFGAELVETLLLVSQRVQPAQLEQADFKFSNPVLAGALESAIA